MNGVSRLIAIQAVRTSANHMIIMSTYASIISLDTATELDRSLFSGLYQYLTGSLSLEIAE